MNDRIAELKSQCIYLVVNGLEVNGSFDDLVSLLGERIDIK